MGDFLKNVLNDIKVELLDEFDRNFERKAFFDQRWPETRTPISRGSLLMRSGNLRRSIRARLSGYELAFYSSMPYAKIQNEGGEIIVTAKMKSYFWAMYYKSAGSITYNIKSRSAANTQRNQKLAGEASYWKALALKKVGTKIRITPRRFIGPHEQVREAVIRVIGENIKEQFNNLNKTLRK